MTITITDNEHPLITCIGNQTKDMDPDACFYTVQGTEFDPVSVSDNCSIASISNSFNNSATLAGVQLPQGVTNITWSVTDGSGNTATCSFSVTVNDSQAPVITCQSDLTTGTSPNECYFQVTGNEFDPIVVSDNCGVVTVVNDYNDSSSLNGALFPVGLTTVIWTASDGSGNTSTCISHITVSDDELPTIICSDDQLRNTSAGVCSYIVQGTEFDPLSVNDNCIIQSVVNNFNGSNSLEGAELPVGITTITWTVTDGNGNTASCSFNVTVSDNENPTITCIGDQTRNTDSMMCFYTVQGEEFDPLASGDNCSIASLINNYNNSSSLEGAEFPLGITNVKWTITDESGNTATCNFNITITDNQPPFITCPDNIVQVNDSGQCTAYITVPTPVFGDNCEVASITNDYNGTANASDVYPRGTTVVTFTVADNYDNTTTCAFNITVTDEEAPLVTCPDDILNVPVDPGTCNASLNPGIATASDNCPEGVTIEGVRSDGLPLSDPYPAGLTTITWAGTDQSGNTGSCVQSIMVIDNEKPTVTCPPDLLNVTADAGKCNATVDPGVPDAHDNCTNPVTDITGVRSDSFALTDPYPLGETIITWTVKDAAGNTATCSQTIRVYDNEKPVITCPDVPLQVTQPGECDMYVSIPVPETSDNCGVASFANNYNGTTDASGIYSTGITTVTYNITDIYGNSDSCNFLVTVESPILAHPDSVLTSQGIPIEINVLVNDVTCENNIDNTTLTMYTPPEHGTYSIDTANGTINYVPANDFFGWETFEYEICDMHGYCSIGQVVIYVDFTNSRDVAVDDYDTAYINKPSIFYPLANDLLLDPEDTLKITSICLEPSHGLITVNPDMSITYTPITDYVGPDEFCYEMCDNGFPVLCDTAMVYIQVLELNTPNVYNVLTPNGDGINDVLIIGDISEYPENELYIYNRWGDEIAKFKNYNNQTNAWDCRREKDNKIVPSGVYYYILKVYHPNYIYKGWIYVISPN